MKESKKQLRRVVLQRLKVAAASDQAQLRSFELRCRMAPLLQGKSGCIAVYAPLPHEVNLLPLIDEYPGWCFAFPRCLPHGQMVFHQVTHPEADLEPAAMGILAPRADLRLIQPEEIDILIVPGVAFTHTGQRLGYGGGYYDRYMPRCTHARILALAFAEQMEPHIPTEHHDLLIPEIIHL